MYTYVDGLLGVVATFSPSSSPRLPPFSPACLQTIKMITVGKDGIKKSTPIKGDAAFILTLSDWMALAGIKLSDSNAELSVAETSPTYRLTGVDLVVSLTYTNYRNQDMSLDSSPECEISVTATSNHFAVKEDSTERRYGVRFKFLINGSWGNTTIYTTGYVIFELFILLLISHSFTLSVATYFGDGAAGDDGEGYAPVEPWHVTVM